jgi:rfaE bifunctional protein nucleotidyltransferase chain/domain
MTQRIVMTSGVFDLLHRGHLNLLRASRALGDKLIVGVVSDDGAAAYKRPPIQDERTRLEVIRSLVGVDCALLQSTTDPTPLVELVRPDVFTHGDDWERLLRGQETLERLGVAFVRLPYTPGISTSMIRERIHA